MVRLVVRQPAVHQQLQTQHPQAFQKHIAALHLMQAKLESKECLETIFALQERH